MPKEPKEHVITLPTMNGLSGGLCISDDGHLVQLVTQVCTRCRADIQLEVWKILSEHSKDKRAATEAVMQMIDTAFPNAMQDYRIRAKHAT